MKKEFTGPGHNCFTKDEDGNDIMIYHARTETEIEEILSIIQTVMHI